MFIVPTLVRVLSLLIVSLGLYLSPCKVFGEAVHLAQSNNFDLPGQALQSSLIEFALQANITVIADNQLLQDHYSAALNGPFRIDEALNRLLDNSGLGYEYLPDSASIVIQPAVAAKSQSLVSNEVDPVEEILVTGVRYPFYYNTVTNTQTRGGASYFDSSRFLNVLPHALLEDQQVSDLGDILKYASGITPGDGASDTNDDIFIRGYQRHAIYLDGFRLSDSSGVKLSPANTDKIEIIKGPATLFYGQAEPGGIVNVIRKKPQSSRFLHMELGAGSLGRQFITLDANGQPLPQSDIDMRLVLSDAKQAEAGEVENIHTQFAAPSVAWQISDATSISASYNYQNETRGWNRDFMVLRPYADFEGATLSQIAPQYQEDFNAEVSLYSAEINHYLGSEWRLQASYFWQREYRHGIRTSSDALLKSDILMNRKDLGNDFISYVIGGQLLVPLVIDTSGATNSYSAANIRSLYDAADTEYGQNVAASLEGSLAFGDVVHHLTVGADWTNQDVYKQVVVESRNLFPGQTWSEDELDSALLTIVKGLRYNTPVSDVFETEDLRLLYDDYGAYIQDNIEFNQRWILSLGTRYTITEGEYANVSDWDFTALPDYQNFSSQLGVTYKASDRQSVFFNYSEAMRASYHNADISLQSPVPVLSEQFEIGVKSLSDSGRLLASVAFYSIEKRNIVTIKVIEGNRTSLAAHQQNVRGMDLDFTWQVSQKFDVMSGFSLIDAEIVSGEDAGKRPPLVADKTASLFGRYKINRSTNMSVGIKYVGSRSGYSPGVLMIVDSSTADALDLKPYTTVDMAIDHKFNWGAYSPVLTISAKNLFNEKYYTAVLGGFRQNEAEARAITAGLEVDF